MGSVQLVLLTAIGTKNDCVHISAGIIHVDRLLSFNVHDISVLFCHGNDLLFIHALIK